MDRAVAAARQTKALEDTAQGVKDIKGQLDRLQVAIDEIALALAEIKVLLPTEKPKKAGGQ